VAENGWGHSSIVSAISGVPASIARSSASSATNGRSRRRSVAMRGWTFSITRRVDGWLQLAHENQNALGLADRGRSEILEHETGLEPATPTLAGRFAGGDEHEDYAGREGDDRDAEERRFHRGRPVSLLAVERLEALTGLEHFEFFPEGG